MTTTKTRRKGAPDKTRRKSTGEPEKMATWRLPAWLYEAVHEYAGACGTSGNDLAEKILLMLFTKGGVEVGGEIDEAVALLLIESAKVSGDRLSAYRDQLAARRTAVDEAIKDAKGIDPKRTGRR